jgi:hypothetical protein
VHRLSVPAKVLRETYRGLGLDSQFPGGLPVRPNSKSSLTRGRHSTGDFMNVAVQFSVSLRTWWPWQELRQRILVPGTILVIILVFCRQGCSLSESFTIALTAGGAVRAALATGSLPEVNK